MSAPCWCWHRGEASAFERARRLLGERVCAVPRLRQRLRRAPPGCGRPFWADDPAFDLRHHVRQVPCPAPGDERALLDVAAAVTGEPLPRSRPLWSATFVTGLADGGTGLVIVMNHVLADGIGGLAVLARLVDESSGPAARYPAGGRGSRSPAPGHARSPPTPGRAGRVRLTHPAGSVRTIRQGLAELGGARPPRRLPPTSLNRPTGPQRRLDVVAADLAAIRDLGHACGGTVNDVILAAIAGALRALLASRGEELGLVTVSVPVSARQARRRRPARQPGRGDAGGPARRRRPGRPRDPDRRDHPRAQDARPAAPRPPCSGRCSGCWPPPGCCAGSSTASGWSTPSPPTCAGPPEPLTLAGAALGAVIPIPNTTGNVTITFAALSYAGTLRITVLSDPAGCRTWPC